MNRGFLLCLDVARMDLFPQTDDAAYIKMNVSGHVETVAILSREKVDDYIRISVHTKDLKPKAN